MNDEDQIIELQLTGEQTTCSEDQLNEMIKLSKQSVQLLIQRQKEALSA
jgi:ribonuclease PH